MRRTGIRTCRLAIFGLFLTGACAANDGGQDAGGDTALDAVVDPGMSQDTALLPCTSSPVTFHDNGDGTVTASNGLVWQQRVLPEPVHTDDRLTACDALGSGWSLPDILQLRSLLVGCPPSELGGTCPMGPGCLTEETCFGASRDPSSSTMIDSPCHGCVPDAYPPMEDCFLDPAFVGCGYGPSGSAGHFNYRGLLSSTTLAWSQYPVLLDVSTGAMGPGGATHDVLCVRLEEAAAWDPAATVTCSKELPWPGTSDPAHFRDNGDGTVADLESGLTWEQRPTDQDLDHPDAVAHCLAKGAGWSLPSIDQLRTLVVGCPALAPGGDCPTSAACSTPETCYGPQPQQGYRPCEGCEFRQGPGPRGVYLDAAFDRNGFQSFWSSTVDPIDQAIRFGIDVAWGGLQGCESACDYPRGTWCVFQAR